MFHSYQIVVLVVLVLATVAQSSKSTNLNFIYNGFQSANLALDGIAHYTDDGLLMLTDNTKRRTGHAFFPLPIPFKHGDSSEPAEALSFSTSFAFTIVAEYQHLRGHGSECVGGHGLAFVISPTKDLSANLPCQYLGLFNSSSIGDPNNHLIAIELDIFQDSEFGDINDNHVGIDINSVVSVASASAGYYSPHQYDTKTVEFKNLSLNSGHPMVVWVDYDAGEKLMDVTLAPLLVGKPEKPLLSYSRDLSSILQDNMYVGFSASDGALTETHNILGWSFALNGQAQDLMMSQVQRLPRAQLPHPQPPNVSYFLLIMLPVITMGIFVLVFCLAYLARKRKFAEELEEWEMKYGPYRFKYDDLYVATKGFKDKQMLGKGGFGKVYKGVLPDTKVEIAVKRVSHDSKQGIREFVSEIVSSGRLHHRNLVPLLGYCRRKQELLLVYDYMPNGSLDKYLYNQPNLSLRWEQRFSIIKGVASGLLYLHEEWEQVVIHRDIKASNVLLDGEFNARIGDFGLARLYDHGSDPHTTHAAGTIGYLAPELTTTGKATRSTDIYAFGAFLLEVACGRRPIGAHATVSGGVNMILMNLVFEHWTRGELLEVLDPNLRKVGEYKVEEVELVLKLGLMCSNVEPSARPTTRQVVQYLGGMHPLPDLSALTLGSRGLTYAGTCSQEYGDSLVMFN